MVTFPLQFSQKYPCGSSSGAATGSGTLTVVATPMLSVDNPSGDVKLSGGVSTVRGGEVSAAASSANSPTPISWRYLTALALCEYTLRPFFGCILPLGNAIFSSIRAGSPPPTHGPP